ncbi:hypothetical protein CR513_42323, partial [Mucuna pruriens]
MFGDPRIKAMESELTGLQRQSKRKWEELDSRGNEESKETLEIECWAEGTRAESSLSRERRADNGLGGCKVKGGSCQRPLSPTPRVVKYKLYNEHLEKQRRQGLAELAKEKRKAVD